MERLLTQGKLGWTLACLNHVHAGMVNGTNAGINQSGNHSDRAQSLAQLASPLYGSPIVQKPIPKHDEDLPGLVGIRINF